jgi:phosphoglycolate phosphatase
MRAILFDKDGTLLDFEATWSPVLHDLALDAADGDIDRARVLMARGGFNPENGRFRAGSVLAAGTSRSIVELWRPELGGAAFAEAVARMDAAFHRHGERHSVAIAGVAATVERLAAAGFVMGVATNDATIAAQASLAALGMADRLPFVFGYDSVPRPKPAPDLVFAFAEASAVRPDETVVVGDNPHDMEMARAAGATAIGVTSGNSSADDLAALADVILPSVAALPDGDVLVAFWCVEQCVSNIRWIRVSVK